MIEPGDMRIIRDRVRPIDVERIALSILSIKNNTKLKVKNIFTNFIVLRMMQF